MPRGGVKKWATNRAETRPTRVDSTSRRRAVSPSRWARQRTPPSLFWLRGKEKTEKPVPVLFPCPDFNPCLRPPRPLSPRLKRARNVASRAGLPPLTTDGAPLPTCIAKKAGGAAHHRGRVQPAEAHPQSLQPRRAALSRLSGYPHSLQKRRVHHRAGARTRAGGGHIFSPSLARRVVVSHTKETRLGWRRLSYTRAPSRGGQGRSCVYSITHFRKPAGSDCVIARGTGKPNLLSRAEMTQEWRSGGNSRSFCGRFPFSSFLGTPAREFKSGAERLLYPLRVSYKN